DRAAAKQTIQDRPETRRATALTVHRHSVPTAQNRADNREAEQALASEVIYGAFDKDADQWRVDNTRVVGSNDHRPRKRNALRIVRSRPEIQSKKQAKEEPTAEITWAQSSRISRVHLELPCLNRRPT